MEARTIIEAALGASMDHADPNGDASPIPKTRSPAITASRSHVDRLGLDFCGHLGLAGR